MPSVVGVSPVLPEPRHSSPAFALLVVRYATETNARAALNLARYRHGRTHTHLGDFGYCPGYDSGDSNESPWGRQLNQPSTVESKSSKAVVSRLCPECDAFSV